MSYTSEFIVGSVDPSDEIWKFFNGVQKLDDDENQEDQDPHGRFAKKFTSLATNATIFRWKFGDQHGNPIVETTINPYIHRFHGPGTYTISHQSCYPCISTGTLICSNGWCTQTVTITAGEPGTIMLGAGLFGLLFIAKSDDCCEIRKRCMEKLSQCDRVKPEDTENKNACKSIRELCNDRLKDCKIKCIKTDHQWDDTHNRCHEKYKSHEVVCQKIERRKKDNNKQSNNRNNRQL